MGASPFPYTLCEVDIMKRIATKAGALAGVALVLLTMFAGVPVYAASWFDQWMETSADLLWNTIDSAYNYIDSTLGIIMGAG